MTAGIHFGAGDSLSDWRMSKVGADSVMMTVTAISSTDTNWGLSIVDRGATPRQRGPRYLVVHEYKCSITGGRLDHQHTLLHQLHHCNYHFYPTNPAILYITTWFFLLPRNIFFIQSILKLRYQNIYASLLDSSDSVEEDGEARVAHTVAEGDGDSSGHSQYFIIIVEYFF